MAVNNNGIKISQLDQASNLNDGNIMPVVQDYVELGETVRETKKNHTQKY